MDRENDLALLTLVGNDVERELLMGILQAEGIEAMVRDAATNCGLKPYLGQQARDLPGLETQIYVHGQDVERARALLAALESVRLSDEELAEQAMAFVFDEAAENGG